MRDQLSDSESNLNDTDYGNEEAGGGTSITRRKFLGTGAAAGVALAGYAFLGYANDAHANGPYDPVLPGIVTRVGAPNTLHVVNRAGPAIARFSGTATFWRDGPARLTDFLPGDEVVAEGAWAENVFSATNLVCFFHAIHGTVTAVGENLYVTTTGIVRVTQYTRFQNPASKLAVGTAIFAIGRLDNMARQLVAGKIGLNQD